MKIVDELLKDLEVVKCNDKLYESFCEWFFKEIFAIFDKHKTPENKQLEVMEYIGKKLYK